ncbi:MAG: transposase, partial [Candidatus Nanopelagicales bacterium]
MFDIALHELREPMRAAKSRNAAPTAAVVDSSSVKASPAVGPRGFDWAKKIDGIKRHILVDSGGLLLSVEVTAADMQDRAILPGLIKSAMKHCPDIAKIWADKGYTGPSTRELAATT